MNKIRIQAFTGTGAFFENTLARNYLASFLDVHIAVAEMDHTPANIAGANFAAIANYLYVQHPDMLTKAAGVLQLMHDNGMFAGNNLDEMVLQADTAMNAETTADGDVSRWFIDNVIGKHQFVESEDSTRRYMDILREEHPDAIGRTLTTAERNQLISQIKGSGFGFCYIFLTDEYVESIRRKFPMVAVKRSNERELMRAWASDLQAYFTLDTIQNYLLAGFFETVGKHPQEYIEEAVKLGQLPEVKNVPAIGWVQVVIAVIGLISAIVTVIGQIIAAGMTKPSNYAESVVPDSNDFHLPGTTTGTGTGSDGSTSASIIPGTSNTTQIGRAHV